MLKVLDLHYGALGLFPTITMRVLPKALAYVFPREGGGALPRKERHYLAFLLHLGRGWYKVGVPGSLMPLVMQAVGTLYAWDLYKQNRHNYVLHVGNCVEIACALMSADLSRPARAVWVATALASSLSGLYQRTLGDRAPFLGRDGLTSFEWVAVVLASLSGLRFVHQFDVLGRIDRALKSFSLPM